MMEEKRKEKSLLLVLCFVFCVQFFISLDVELKTFAADGEVVDNPDIWIGGAP